jgi:hypothetical protein
MKHPDRQHEDALRFFKAQKIVVTGDNDGRACCQGSGNDMIVAGIATSCRQNATSPTRRPRAVRSDVAFPMSRISTGCCYHPAHDAMLTRRVMDGFVGNASLQRRRKLRTPDRPFAVQTQPLRTDVANQTRDDGQPRSKHTVCSQALLTRAAVV